jgi:hypothetical protein
VPPCAEARDEAVEVALGVVAQLHRHRHRLAEQVFRLEVGLGAQQVELRLAERAQGRRRCHRLEQQVGGRQRGFKRDGRRHVQPSPFGGGNADASASAGGRKATKVIHDSPCRRAE